LLVAQRHEVAFRPVVGVRPSGRRSADHELRSSLVVRRRANACSSSSTGNRSTTSRPAPARPTPNRSDDVSMALQCGRLTHSGRAQWPLIKSRSARSHNVGCGTVRDWVVPVKQPVEQDVLGDQV
jgi:hypothetical protein